MLLVATAAVSVVAESLATYGGGGSGGSWTDRSRRLVESITATVAVRNRGTSVTADQGTKRILVGGTLLGLFVMVAVATRSPWARVGSNDWFGVVVGVSLALSGIALRVWAVKTLGRYFQREVVVEPGQGLVRRGPYRWVRHPAYAGNLLALFGFGVALGSWVGAIIGAAIILAAHIPRILVEERVLSTTFPTYTTDTADARIIPGVW